MCAYVNSKQFVLLLFCSGMIPQGQRTSFQNMDIEHRRKYFREIYHLVEQWFPDFRFSQACKSFFFKSEIDTRLPVFSFAT